MKLLPNRLRCVLLQSLSKERGPYVDFVKVDHLMRDQSYSRSCSNSASRCPPVWLRAPNVLEAHRAACARSALPSGAVVGRINLHLTISISRLALTSLFILQDAS